MIDEERHFDQYDRELDILRKIGDRYLALRSMERSKGREADPAGVYKEGESFGTMKSP